MRRFVMAFIGLSCLLPVAAHADTRCGLTGESSGANGTASPFRSGLPTMPNVVLGVIPVAFPDDPPQAQAVDWVEMVDAFQGFETFIQRQSRGQMTVTTSYLVNPVTGGKWIADHPAPTYRSTTYAGPFDACTLPPSAFDIVGTGMANLQAEILYQMADTYAPANPFLESNPQITTLVFVMGNRVFSAWFTDGYGRLELTQSASVDTGGGPMPCLDFLPSAPECNNYRHVAASDPLGCYGLMANWIHPDNATGNVPHHRTDFEHIFSHEYGHLLIGLPHSTHPSQTGQVHAVYSSMKPDMMRAQGYIPYSLEHLQDAEWYPADVPVSETTYGLKIYDVRDGGATYVVDGASSSTLEVPPMVIDYETRFFLSYHPGTYEDAEPNKNGTSLYPSQGLMVRRSYETFVDPDGAGPAPRTSYGILGEQYIESGFGRFSDPGSFTDPNLWDDPDPVAGYSNLSYWPGRENTPYFRYPGDVLDFFAAQLGRDEFSYRTNPHGFGQDYTQPPPRFDRPSGFRLVVTAEGEDAAGKYAIVDIIRAPEEDLVYPAGGECLEVGDSVPVQWSTNLTPDYQGSPAIDAVDLLLSLDGGATFPDTIAAGEAHDGAYDWTPNAGQISGDAVLKLVFHNVFNEVTGSAVSGALSVSTVATVSADDFSWSNNDVCTKSYLEWTTCRAVACRIDWGLRGSSLPYSVTTAVGTRHQVTLNVDPGLFYKCKITPLAPNYQVLNEWWTTQICGSPITQPVSVVAEPLRVAPNPARGSVSIDFGVAGTVSPVTLQVYDVAGRLVRTLTDGALAHGRHSVSWDGQSSRNEAVAPGIYFVRLRAEGREEREKVVLLR